MMTKRQTLIPNDLNFPTYLQAVVWNKNYPSIIKNKNYCFLFQSF